MPAKYTASASAGKANDRPQKPYENFPLYAHPLGYWAKKIKPIGGKAKLRYFGRWGKIRNGKMEHLPYEESWRAALAQFERDFPYLKAGREPIKEGGLTIGDLRDQFLTAKSRALDARDITRRTYFEYKDSAFRLVKAFGEHRLVEDLTANDFAELRAQLASHYGPVRLGNEVQKVRTIFKYGYEAGLIDKPVRFGPEFKKPSARVLRQQRNTRGQRMLEAPEIRLLLSYLAGDGVEVAKAGKKTKVKIPANPQLRAMILLGVNCGFGNHDCATLPLDALDLEKGWISFPRPKTAIERRCPLWPETEDALRAALDARPAPKSGDAESSVFVTLRGRPWLSNDIANPVSVAVRGAMKAVGIHRAGIGFYTLRHVFRTIADGARDHVAANYIMGHSDSSMASHYRERIDDERLLAVTQHVRAWLLG